VRVRQGNRNKEAGSIERKHEVDPRTGSQARDGAKRQEEGRRGEGGHKSELGVIRTMHGKADQAAKPRLNDPFKHGSPEIG
jgi:hypothetical protein